MRRSFRLPCPTRCPELSRPYHIWCSAQHAAMMAPMSSTQERMLVCVPTYNERENLEALVGAAHAALPEADLLIIDDNSPDGTGALADQIAARDPHVKVLHRAGKLGLGT